MESAGPILALIAGGYLLGSILPADWLVKRRVGKSPVELGDNPGGAGAWRLAGPGAAVLTTAFDLAKGALPLAVAQISGLSSSIGLSVLRSPSGGLGRATWLDAILLAAVVCAPIAGHNWSIFHRFRGGRGLASAAGVLVYLAWREMLLALALGVVVAFWRKWVPLIGIVAFLVGLALMLLSRAGTPRVVAAICVMLVVLVKQVPWARANLGKKQGGQG